MLKKYNITISGVTQDGKTCSNPSVVLGDHEGVFLNCINGDNYQIQVDEDYSGPNCLQFIVSCDDCATCPPQVITKCLCENTDDCSNCQECIGGICSDTCPDGICTDDNTCVECDDANPCPNNQVCTSGDCQCPPSHPFLLNGVCVQVEDCADCPACTVCRDNNCYPVVCPEGVCDPLTDTCVECSDNSHCGPNEICLEGGTCGCAPGYHLDILTGLCVVTPECNLNSECPDCQQCVDGVCVPIICPPNQICVDDDCVTSCTDGDDCPDGYGCYNGVCVACNELACESPCIFASGCGCVDDNCVDISDDCDSSNVTLLWEYVEPEGTPNPSTPGLTGSFTVTNNGVVNTNTSPPNGFASNFTFSYSMNTTGVSGVWYYSPSSGVETQVSTASTVSVFHGDAYVGNNFLGFRMIFRASDGRNLVYESTRTGGLQDSNWSTSLVSASSIGGGFSGDAGYWTLCSNNPAFTFSTLIPVQTVVTATSATPITITFTENLGSCLKASISGCGEWNSKIRLGCLGSESLFDIPPFVVDETSCCDAQDPDCQAGPGEPCVETTETVPLILEPFYQDNNQYFVYPDLNTIPFSQLYSMTTTWSVSANNSTNDLSIDESGLYAITTHEDGGCINFQGTTSCITYTGQDCLDQCSDFSTYLHEVDATTYNVVPSYFGTPAVLYNVTSGASFVDDSYFSPLEANIYVVELTGASTTIGTVNITGVVGDCENTVTIDISCNNPTVTKNDITKAGDNLTGLYTLTGIVASDTITVSVDGVEIDSSFYALTGSVLIGTLTIDFTNTAMSSVPVLRVEVTNDCGSASTESIPNTSYDAPIAVDDAYELVLEGVAICLDVLDNDTEPNGLNMIISHVDGAPITFGDPAVFLNSAFEIAYNGNCPGGLELTSVDDTFLGTSIFTYTIFSPTTGLSDTATVTLTVVPACEGTIGALNNVTTCATDLSVTTVTPNKVRVGNTTDYSLFANFNDITAATTIDVGNFSEALVSTVDFSLDSCGVITTYSKDFLTSFHGTAFSIDFSSDPNTDIDPSSIQKILGLKNEVGTSIDILFPETFQACGFFSGVCPDNTCDCLRVPTDYATSSTNRAIWQDAVKIVIVQSLLAQGYIEGTHFNVGVTLSANGIAIVYFGTNSVDADPWLGIEVGASQIEKNKTLDSYLGIEVIATIKSFIFYEDTSPCGIGTASVNTGVFSVPVITPGSIDHDAAVIDSTPVPGLPLTGANVSCVSYEFQTAVADCDSPTYQWYLFTGGVYLAMSGITTADHVPTVTGYYKVIVTCNGDPTCTAEATLSIAANDPVIA